MAFIRCCVFTALLALCISTTNAQTIYYPANASQLLKATAEDVAMLLQKSIAGSHFGTQAYTTLPSSGIVFIYDSSIIHNQSCKMLGDRNILVLAAKQDNGLVFGVYEYLRQLGFKFYQPGSIWEIIPTLSSPFKIITTTVAGKFKYNSWFVSGGCNRWAMDKNADYGWDTYFGENGHNWALYQRRNGMLGEYRFAGHRGDVMNASYVNTLKNNPCLVATYNGNKLPNARSVADVTNTSAMNLWSTTIEQGYTSGRNTILNNPTLYTNVYHNFDYYNNLIGIEVPDAAEWGNSKSTNTNCTQNNYPSESDQQFTLANYTAENIGAKYPQKQFQVYAYSTHANVPSSSIVINKNIDVQLIPGVYQQESTANGLRNRWYNRSKNVSEYQYLNLSNWSGEIPSFRWKDIKATLQIAQDKKSQGVVWEASPAKFGSLPLLFAANNKLQNNVQVDSTLQEFCTTLFAEASTTIYEMFQKWGDKNFTPNRLNMHVYLQLLNTAVQQIKNSSAVVKQRIQELKAYIHYMVMYFNVDEKNSQLSKEQRDGLMCMYLAKTNKLQLVNSYYLISSKVSGYANTSDFYIKYNIANGTAYQNGTLPLITNVEIDANFLADLNNCPKFVNDFKMEEAIDVKNNFAANNLEPLAKITTKITYTNGINYYNKTSFNIISTKASSFNIEYTPRFDMPEKGYLNFVVEDANKALLIVKDFSINNTNKAGTIQIDLPAAGEYVLTLTSKFKTSLELSITTNGNYFFKNEPFLGNKTENYRDDLTSLPGFFYIPKSTNKVYFTVANTYSNGKCATEDIIAKSFLIKDNNGNFVTPHFLTPKDSTLFYLDIPANANGTFWQATSMGQYNLQFVNTSNLLWFAKQFAVVKKEDIKQNVTITESPILVKAFPNPSTGIFKFTKDGKSIIAEKISITNSLGMQVANFNNVGKIDISQLSVGMYIYTLYHANKRFTGKLIKQ